VQGVVKGAVKVATEVGTKAVIGATIGVQIEEKSKEEERRLREKLREERRLQEKLQEEENINLKNFETSQTSSGYIGLGVGGGYINYHISDSNGDEVQDEEEHLQLLSYLKLGLEFENRSMYELVYTLYALESDIFIYKYGVGINRLWLCYGDIFVPYISLGGEFIEGHLEDEYVEEYGDYVQGFGVNFGVGSFIKFSENFELSFGYKFSLHSYDMNSSSGAFSSVSETFDTIYTELIFRF
jgi:hypothetical protein